MANGSEWEYEYDEQETEVGLHIHINHPQYTYSPVQDFYITLDLTTQVPPNLVHEKKSKSNKRGSNKSLANAPGATGKSSSAKSSTVTQDDGASFAEQSLAASRMQIVDLHGANPLVSFNNALYSCHWATDVGTSLFLTAPPETTDPNHPPLHSTPSFDLLGTSFARLIAAPATIRARETPLTSLVPGDQTQASHETVSTAEGDLIRKTDTGGFRITLPSTATSSRVNQARFLERLSNIKAKRGDKDNVPVSHIKIYRPPPGWEAERDEWIAKETVLSDRNRLEAETRKAKSALRKVRFAPTHSERAADDGYYDEEEEDHGDDDADADDGGETSDQDRDTPEPGSLAEQMRKRKTRGGSRGGAPSSKKLRQSLGLPESRRDKRAVGRPRQIRLDPEFEEAGAEQFVEGEEYEDCEEDEMEEELAEGEQIMDFS